MAIIKPEQLQSGSYSISGSFSGSFQGDGSGLTGVGDTNFATTDLTLTGNRYHDLNGNNLIVSGGNARLYLDASNGDMMLGDTDYGFQVRGSKITTYVSGSKLIQINKESVVFNRNGLDNDFTVGSENNQEMFVIDAATDRIGIGKSAPNSVLDVKGNQIVTGKPLSNPFLLKTTDSLYI